MPENNENKKKEKADLDAFLNVIVQSSTDAINKLKKIDKSLEDTSDSLDESIERLKKLQD